MPSSVASVAVACEVGIEKGAYRGAAGVGERVVLLVQVTGDDDDLSNPGVAQKIRGARHQGRVAQGQQALGHFAPARTEPQAPSGRNEDGPFHPAHAFPAAPPAARP